MEEWKDGRKGGTKEKESKGVSGWKERNGRIEGWKKGKGNGWLGCEVVGWFVS